MAKYKLKLKRLDWISPVDEPAQETARVLLIKRKALSGFARVAKVDEGLGLVFCWAFTSKANGEDYYDLQGDNVDEDFIKAAADFMASGGPTDEMHDGDADGRVVFAFPMTPEIAKSFGIESETTGLMVALKPSADVFAKFKSGEYTGVSIEGIGERTKVANARKGTWSTATVDDFPDSSFLYIEPGGKKDDEGKTTPRSLRHFPYKDGDGKIDVAHLRDAIGRIPQSSLPASLREKLQTKAEKLLAAQHAKNGKRAPKGECADCGESMPVDAEKCEKCGGPMAYKRMSKRAILTSVAEGHQHVLDDGDDGTGPANAGETDYRTTPGDSGQYVAGHSHPWVRMPDGSFALGMADGHTHEADAKDPDGDGDDDTSEIGDVDGDAGKRAGISTPLAPAPHVGGMATQPITSADAELQKKLDATTGRLDAIAKMSTAHAAHWAKLDGAKRDAFVAKSNAERDADIVETAKGDEHAYTADDGSVYTKRDDARLVAQAKRADESERAYKDEALSKRAAIVFKGWGGDELAHKAHLRAIEKIADEAVRKTVLESIKAASVALAELSIAKGIDPGEDAETTSPLALEKRFDVELTKFAKANKYASNARAFEDFVSTREGSDLYQAHQAAMKAS